MQKQAMKWLHNNRWGKLLLVVGIAVLLWLPRGFGLAGYATADENAWLTRSANFSWALARADWADTFQRHHPGVTVTWAGTLGFWTVYPAYSTETERNFGWLAEELTPFLRAHGHQPNDLLAAGRSFAVLFVVLALTTTFLFAWRLVGLWPALVGMLLLAFDPFHIAHSRLMHLDGLLSSFMLLAAVALLVALNRTERVHWQWSALFVAGLATGLAWLTRSPGLLLLPFAALLGSLRWAMAALQPDRGAIEQRASALFLLGRLIAWGSIGSVTFVLLWPAMWVAPWGSLSAVLSAANEYAAEGHADPIFFNGAIYNGDPGFWFYPITWLWRTTPVVLLGLLFALFAWGGRWMKRLRNRGGTAEEEITQACHRQLFSVGSLCLLALLFVLLMSMGAKKFDRYLLPVYPALDLVAGWGWVAACLWLRRRWPGAGRERALGLALLLVVGLQIATALPHYPYYLTYYNPLLGGGDRAVTVMQIGRGEGADRAATLLNRDLAEPAATTVASAFPNGPFSYFFQGRTVPPTFWQMADYAVLYMQDLQRRLPSPRQVAWLESLVPRQRIELHGIEYARVYDLQSAPTPTFVTTWAMAETALIRLNAYELTAGKVQPSETIRTTLYLENLAPIPGDLNVLVRLVGADGTEIVRSEGWPWGAPTSSWPQGEIRPDGHNLTMPATTPPGIYRLDVGFYVPESGQMLAASAVRSAQPLPDLVPLDFIEVGTPTAATAPAEGAAATTVPMSHTLGRFAELSGYAIAVDGPLLDSARPSLRAGETVTLTLAWQTLTTPPTDYTAFVHLVGEDGTLLTQQDQQPTAGFLPTTLWRSGQSVTDRYRLTLPATAPAGTYQLYVGLYELATLTRLPVRQANVVVGDRVPLLALEIVPTAPAE